MSEFTNRSPTGNTYLDIARGVFKKLKPLNIFGFNTTIGTSYETAWTVGGKYTYPASALNMSVVSASASDTMSLLIQGLDANYLEISETVTLTGITPVTTSNDYLRINNAVLLSDSNVGNITISNGGTTYARIDAGVGITQQCVYTVPANKSLYLVRIDVNSATANPNKYITLRNQTRTKTGRILKVAEATFSTSQVSYDRQIPFKIDECTDFEFEAKSSSGENEIAFFVEAILGDNPTDIREK